MRTARTVRTSTGRRDRQRWSGAGLLAGSALIAALLTPGANPAARDRLLGAVPAGPAAPTPAAPPARAVPRHHSDVVGLHLLAASAEGYLVSRGGPALNGSSELLAGRRGATLAEQDLRPRGYRTVYDVSGRIFSWADSGADPARWRVHRIDLKTGTAHSFASAGEPMAWTPDGWISWQGSTLTRYVAGVSHRVVLHGVRAPGRGGPARPVVSADAAGLVVHAAMSAGSEPKDRIVLVPLDDAAPAVARTVLASVPYPSVETSIATSGLGAQALSERLVAWVSWSDSGRREQVLHRQPRAGGPQTTLVLPDDVDLSTLTAAGDRVAMLRTPGAQGTTEVAVLGDGGWRTVTLPGPTRGLRAAGSEFFAAVDGPTGVAGVYAIGSGGAFRVARVPAPTVGVTAVSLSAGRLSYLDSAVHGGQDGALWQRAVTGGTGGRPVKFGPEHRIAPPGPQTDGPDLAMSLSTSAGRALAQTRTETPAAYRLLDRGRPPAAGHLLPVTGRPATVRASGPYTLVGSQVFGPDAEPVLDLDTQAGTDADLFGSELIHSSADGTVRVRDVTAPVSLLTPTTLAESPACARDHLDGSCPTEVAIWGPTVAWSRRDGTISIRTRPDPAIRSVATGERVTDLRLSEGVLAWRTPNAGGAEGNRDSIRLLDLTSARSRPLTMTGLSAVSVDGHLMAGIDAQGRVAVRALPFGGSKRYPPRLLGVTASTDFTIPGRWSPGFDATTELTGVRLTLARDGVVVRTLTGSGADGSIRNLHWDGTDDAGNPLPAGTYGWRLAAAAKDGGGPLVTVDARALTGSVRLAR